MHDYEGPSRAASYSAWPRSTTLASQESDAPRGPGLAERAIAGVEELETMVATATSAYAALPTHAEGWQDAFTRFTAALPTPEAARRTRFAGAAVGDWAVRREAARGRLAQFAAVAPTLRPPIAGAVIPARTAEPVQVGAVADETTAHAPAQQPAVANDRAATDPAIGYLKAQTLTVWTEVTRYLGGITWPDLDARLPWRSERTFTSNLVGALRAGALDHWGTTALREVFYPFDVQARINQLGPSGPSSAESVGALIAQLLQQVVVDSLARLGPRYLESADALRGFRSVQLDDLILSSPLDGYVGRAMTQHGVLHHVRATGVLNPRTEPRTLRPVALAWQGAHDAKLWNWIVAEPADATVEEVAASLFDYAAPLLDGISPSVFAYGIAAAPPFFALPIAWALRFPEAREHAPKSALTATPEAEPLQDRLVALAGSDEADRLALAQASGEPVAPLDRRALAEVFGDCRVQLAAIARRLTPWALADRVAPVQQFVLVKQNEALSLPVADLGRWTAVGVGQKQRLFEIAGMLGALPASAATSSGPLHDVAAQITRAAATSHLTVTCRALMRNAYQAEAALTVQSLQTSLAALTAEQQEMRASIGNDGGTRAQADPYLATQSRGQHLLTELINGEDVDPDDIELVQLDAQELALRARAHRLTVTLEELAQAARAANDGIIAHLAARGSSKFRSIDEVSRHIVQELTAPQVALAQAKARSLSAPSRNQAAAIRRESLTTAQTAIREIGEEHDLQHFFRDGYELVKDQQVRTAWLRAAALLAITIGTMGVGELAGGVVAGPLLTAQEVETVAELSLVARTAVKATTLVTDAAIQSAAQTAIEGGSFTDALISNLMIAGISEVSITAILKNAKTAERVTEAMAHDIETIARLDAQAASRTATVAKWAVKTTFSVTAHAFMGMAIASCVDQLRGKPLGTIDAQAVLINGATVAVGRLVHGVIAERLPTLAHLAEIQGGERGKRLVADATQLATDARIVERGGNALAAIDLLSKQHQVLADELAILDDPAVVASHGHGGPTEHERIAMKSDLQVQVVAASSDAMFDIKLHLLGLEEVVPGSEWKGSQDEVRRAVKEAQRTGQHVEESWDETTQATTLLIDGRSRIIYDRAPSARPERGPHELATNVASVAGSASRQSTYADANGVAILVQQVSPVMTHLVGEVGAVAIEGAGQTYVVRLANGSFTAIDIVFVRLGAGDTARLVVNSSRHAEIMVNGHARKVVGQHTVQVTTATAAVDLERVLGDSVARVIAVHERAVAGDHPAGRANGHQAVPLTPDEIGRLAELRVLGRQLAEHPERTVELRREVIALAEHLGLSDPARKGQFAPLLDEHARRALAEAAGASKSEVAAVRDRIHGDLEVDEQRRASRALDRDAPYDLAGPGQRIPADELAQFASAAARLRSLTSERTLRDLRAKAAKLKPGQLVSFDNVQLGGGASLAGRAPNALLVDVRGRWQADANANIAQTAQQLQELFKAQFGDVRQVAAPNERIPLDAIRYWEDTLAAQGPVIDGRGSLRMDAEGRIVLDIAPSDGSAALTIAIKGAPVISTGFPPETVPGNVRIGMGDVVWQLESKLTLISKHAKTTGVRDAAEQALRRVRSIDKPRLSDSDIIDGLVRGPHEAELRALLAGDALTQLEQNVKWRELVAADRVDGQNQIVFGDDVNLRATIDSMLTKDAKGWIPKRWVFAGAGGTAVSAAEAVLAHPETHVTLVSQKPPRGLLENTQFRGMAAAHGDAAVARMVGGTPGDARLSLVVDQAFDAKIPTVGTAPDGHTTYEAAPSSDGRFVGDAYVLSIGRAQQLPPEVADIVLRAERNKFEVTYYVIKTPDHQYGGYRVKLTNGTSVKHIDVTGAASRFAPLTKFSESDQQFIQSAREADAPSLGGNFDGGFTATANQSYQLGTTPEDQRPQ